LIAKKTQIPILTVYIHSVKIYSSVEI